MTTTQIANKKLLKELENNENAAIDKIHVWLNQNMTDEIAAGICEEERTLQSCMHYVNKMAKKDFNKTSSGNGVHMVEDQTVFNWVKDFYTLENIEIREIKQAEKKPKIVEQIKTVIKKKAPVTKTKEGFEQLGLFDE